MNTFNVRVYGLLLNEKNEILISDEFRNGYFFSKFPGGGLEFGEGLKDALVREFDEELGILVEVKELFYVNDHLQVSAFNPNHQLLSFYFIVVTKEFDKIGKEVYKIPLEIEGEKQKWMSINSNLLNYLTFPLDKIVCEKLLNYK